MSTLTPEKQRALRRRHKHERQAVVFGSLLAFLALAGLGATAIYTGAMDAPFLSRGFTTPPPEEVPDEPKSPCPPPEALPVAYNTIPLRVLNASGRTGLAGTTATELTGRGFVVAEVGNYTIDLDTGPRILFGEAGLAGAYTLAATVPDALLLLDTRTDASVDLVLGAAYEALAEAPVLDPTIPFEGVPGCISIAEARLVAVPGPTAEPTEPAVDGGATEAPAEGDQAPTG
jgi:hypothetical protein